MTFSPAKTSILVLCLIYGAGLPFSLRAQDPGAQQDAEAAREKLLKAADQIDMIQANSETTKTTLDAMKADISRLQDQNATLKQQVVELQAALEKAEAARVKEQQVLVDEVAKMMASGKNSATPKPPGKKKDVAAAANATPPPPPVKTPDVETAVAGAANPPPAPTADPATAPTPAPAAADPAPAKPQKGYYHIVESGETLTLICSAYRQQGVNVTITEIQKANGLTDKSVLKVGQKLFIPKPET